MDPVEPMLQKRARSRDEEKRHPNGHHEEQNNRQHRILCAIRLPSIPWGDREKDQRTHHQTQVNQGLMPRREVACEKMGIGIPDQKKDLKEEHARRPDRRGASKPGKNIPGDDGLYLKQQKCTEKNRNGIRKDRHLGHFGWKESHGPHVDRRWRWGIVHTHSRFWMVIAGLVLAWLEYGLLSTLSSVHTHALDPPLNALSIGPMSPETEP